jgi:alcohol dehydrogenase
LVSCGDCDQCRRGLRHLCRTRSIVGIHRAGAFAEQVAVPESSMHELPDSMTFEQAAMIEPLANGIHALGLARPDEGARIGVIGAGTIGLVSLLAARQHTDDVVVTDLAEHRLEVAQRLGAAAVASTLEGEFDVIIDAVGAPATRRQSVERLRPGGTTVWIGLLGADPGFDATAIIRNEQHVIGSYCYSDDDFGRAIELAGQVDLDWTDSFGLDDGATIFGELAAGRHDVVKALLRPRR